MMNTVTGDDRLVAVRLDDDTDMAGRMSRCRFESNSRSNFVIQFDQIHQPGIDYRLDRLPPYQVETVFIFIL